MNRVLAQETVALGVLFGAGLILRLHQLGSASLNHDEIWAAALWINGSLSDTARTLSHWEFPPLYYLFLNVWSHIFGNSEWSLRAPSAVFSSLTIVVVYKLGKELFNEGVGFISALILAFSCFAVPYAQYAKMYSLFWLLSSVSFLYFFRFLKTARHEAWLGFVVSSVLCCYTMYTGFLILAAQNVAFLLLAQRTGRRQWLSAQWVIGICCMPWIIYFLASKPEHWDSLRPPGVPYDYPAFSLQSFRIIIGAARENWLHVAVNLPFGTLTTLVYVFLIIYFLGDLATVSVQSRRAGLSWPSDRWGLVLWILIPVFFYFLFDRFMIKAGLGVRYLGFLQVPLVLLISAQIDRCQALIRMALVMVLVVTGALNTFAFKSDPQQDWRKTARELESSLGSQDVVLSMVSVPIFKYYYKGDTSRFFTISRRECFLPVLQRRGMINSRVHGIFVLYHHLPKPAIVLEGFFLDYGTYNGGVGFLHFHRPKS